MYKSAAILALAAGVVSAQSVPNIPQCAIKCLSTAAPDAGCNSITDFECLCSSIDEIMQSSSDCFTSECDSQELESAQSAATEFCSGLVGTSSSGSGSVATSTVTSTPAESTVTTPVTVSTVTTPTTPTESTIVTTETDSDGNPTATRTDEPGSSGTGGSGDDGDDSGVGKPAAGLLAAGLALLAAL